MHKVKSINLRHARAQRRRGGARYRASHESASRRSPSSHDPTPPLSIANLRIIRLRWNLGYLDLILVILGGIFLFIL